MTRARRRATAWAVAASVAIHLAAGVALLLEKQAVVAPEPIITVLLVSRPPPVTREARTPTPPQALRLHRRPQLIAPPDVPAAPIAPPSPAPAAPPGHGPVALHPSPLPAGPKDELRAALRHSYVGCANRDVVGLNRAERDFCDEQLGKGAKDAKFAGLGLTAAKQRLLDAAGAAKDRDYRYKRDPMTAPVSRPGPGATAEQMCQNLGVSADECAVHIRK
jgi:hypothetical protein